MKIQNTSTSPLVINGIPINPDHFAVKATSMPELERAITAASEFIRMAKATVRNDSDGIMKFRAGKASPFCPCGLRRHIDGLFFYIGKNIVAFDFSHGLVEVKLDEASLDMDTHHPCGYFGSQPMNALGRFLGQGLIITIPTGEDFWKLSDEISEAVVTFHESALNEYPDELLTWEEYDKRPLYCAMDCRPRFDE